MVPGTQLSRIAAYKSMKVEQSLTLYTKINSKWLKDLNTRCDTVKLLGENIDKTLSDINHSKILSDPPPTVMETKAKINKWDLVKLKSFCTAKETITKRNLHNGRKYLQMMQSTRE